MQTSTVLVATLFALTSFPFMGQSSPQDTAPAGSGVQQPTAPSANQTPGAVPGSQPEQAAPSASAETSAPTAVAPTTPAPELRPVSAELVSNLDTKTAKTGDSVVVQTKAAVKTADGTEIPKGTKLVGRVVGAQASTAGDTSQVAVAFDHAELLAFEVRDVLGPSRREVVEDDDLVAVGDQALDEVGADEARAAPDQAQIQSVGSSDASSAASAGSSAMDRGAMRGSTGTDTSSPSAPGSTASAPSQTPGGAPSGQSPAAGSATTTSAAPGTVVAKTGQIDIRTTAIPGVLLANNQPGQQDPRMAHASSVLLGADKDVQLTGGTPLVIGVATSSGAAGTK